MFLLPASVEGWESNFGGHLLRVTKLLLFMKIQKNLLYFWVEPVSKYKSVAAPYPNSEKLFWLVLAEFSQDCSYGL